MPKHFGSDRGALGILANVLHEMPVEIAFRERRVVARQHAEHLAWIARRQRVRFGDRLGPRVRLRLRRPHPDRPDMLLRHGARRVDPDVEPMLGEIAVLVIAPQRAPGVGLRHHRATLPLPHHGIEVARLLRRQPRRLDPPRRDQKMRVMIRALALAVRAMGRMHVELRRQPLRHEVRFGKAARQLDPVVRADFGIGRQGQNQLPRHLRVAAPLRRLGRVPKSTRVAEGFRRALRQHHLVVIGRVAMGEVEHLAGALGDDLVAAVIGARPHRVAAGLAGNVSGAGEGDGHERQHARRSDRPQAAFEECILRLHIRSEPALRSTVGDAPGLMQFCHGPRIVFVRGERTLDGGRFRVDRRSRGGQSLHESLLAKENGGP